MTESLLTILTFFTEQPWMIPVIGALSASLAFLFGRRFLARPAPAPAATAVPELPPDSTPLVTARLRKSDPDRRGAPRRKGNRIAVFLTDDPDREPLQGWVVDRSMGGLCVMVDKPLAPGIILNIRPRKAPQTAPWIPIQIRSCRADEGEWEIGCKFVGTPQWNDLLLFG
jgi:hypothetical protein